MRALVGYEAMFEDTTGDRARAWDSGWELRPAGARRGRGTMRSLTLGSVSHGVLHHASGPVAVVR